MPKWTLMELEYFYLLKALGFQALIWTQARAETTRTWQLFQRGLGPSNTSCPAIRTKTPTEQTEQQQNGRISVFSCVFSKKASQQLALSVLWFIRLASNQRTWHNARRVTSLLGCWVGTTKKSREQGSDRPPASALVCARQRWGEEWGRTFCSQGIIG